MIDGIPNDSAAALILLEHHWAVPLRDAIADAGGFRISDGFISPLDLSGSGWSAPPATSSARKERSESFPIRGGCPAIAATVEQDLTVARADAGNRDVGEEPCARPSSPC